MPEAMSKKPISDLMFDWLVRFHVGVASLAAIARVLFRVIC